MCGWYSYLASANADYTERRQIAEECTKQKKIFRCRRQFHGFQICESFACNVDGSSILFYFSSSKSKREICTTSLSWHMWNARVQMWGTCHAVDKKWVIARLNFKMSTWLRWHAVFGVRARINSIGNIKLGMIWFVWEDKIIETRLKLGLGSLKLEN